MIHWHDQHSDRFYKVYSRHSIGECSFSALKDCFDHVARYVNLEIQERELAVVPIYRNLFV